MPAFLLVILASVLQFHYFDIWLGIKRYFDKITHFRKWYYFLLVNTLIYVYNILLQQYSCMHVIEQFTVLPWGTLVLQFSFISSYTAYPQANGLVENFNRPIGKVLRTANAEHRNWKQDELNKPQSNITLRCSTRIWNMSRHYEDYGMS